MSKSVFLRDRTSGDVIRLEHVSLASPIGTPLWWNANPQNIWKLAEEEEGTKNLATLVSEIPARIECPVLRVRQHAIVETHIHIGKMPYVFYPYKNIPNMARDTNGILHGNPAVIIPYVEAEIWASRVDTVVDTELSLSYDSLKRLRLIAPGKVLPESLKRFKLLERLEVDFSLQRNGEELFPKRDDMSNYYNFDKLKDLYAQLKVLSIRLAAYIGIEPLVKNIRMFDNLHELDLNYQGCIMFYYITDLPLQLRRICANKISISGKVASTDWYHAITSIRCTFIEYMEFGTLMLPRELQVLKVELKGNYDVAVSKIEHLDVDYKQNVLIRKCAPGLKTLVIQNVDSTLSPVDLVKEWIHLCKRLATLELYGKYYYKPTSAAEFVSMLDNYLPNLRRLVFPSGLMDAQEFVHHTFLGPHMLSAHGNNFLKIAAGHAVIPWLTTVEECIAGDESIKRFEQYVGGKNRRFHSYVRRVAAFLYMILTRRRQHPLRPLARALANNVLDNINNANEWYPNQPSKIDRSRRGIIISLNGGF